MRADDYKAGHSRRRSGSLDLFSHWQSENLDKSVLLVVDDSAIKISLQLKLQENLYHMDTIDSDHLRELGGADRTDYDAIICIAEPKKMQRFYAVLEKIAGRNTKPLMTVLYSRGQSKLVLQYVNNGKPLNGVPRITGNHEQVEDIVRSVLSDAKYLKVEALQRLPLTHSELQDRLREDPKNPRLRFQAGEFYARDGLANLAAEQFCEAIKLDPDNEILTSVEEDSRAALVDLIQTHPGEVSEKYLEDISELTRSIENRVLTGKVGGRDLRILARDSLSEGDPDRAISLLLHNKFIDSILLLIEAYAEKRDPESRRKAFELVEDAEKSSFYAEGPTYQVGLRLPRITGFNTLWIGEPIKRGRGRIVIKRYERAHLERARNETDNVNVLSSHDIRMLNREKLHLANYAVLLKKEGADMAYIIMPLITDPETGKPAKGLDVLDIPSLARSKQVALAELLTDAQTALQNSAILHRTPPSFRDEKFKIEVPGVGKITVGHYTKLFAGEVLPFYEAAGVRIKDRDRAQLIEWWHEDIDKRLRVGQKIFFRPFFDNRIENSLATFKSSIEKPTVEDLINKGILHRIDLEKGERRHFLTDEFMAWGHEWMRLDDAALKYLTTRKVAEILCFELEKLDVDHSEILDALWNPGDKLKAKDNRVEIGDARAKLEEVTRRYLDANFSWDLGDVLEQIPIADAERHIVVSAYQRKRLREYEEEVKKSKYNSVRGIERGTRTIIDVPRLNAEEMDLFKEYCTLMHFIKTQEAYAKYHQIAAGTALLRASNKGNIRRLHTKLVTNKIIKKK